MLKIAVVGDKASVTCFKAFGLDVFPAFPDSPEESRKTVDQLARNRYGIIFVTEPIAATIEETIARYDKATVPAIILIPSCDPTAPKGIGLEKIQKNVEKAVGINILDEGR